MIIGQVSSFYILLIAVFFLPLSSAAHNSDISCSIGSIDKWNNGVVVNNIAVTNSGATTLKDWLAKLTFNHNIQLTGSWNADISAVNKTVSAKGATSPDLNSGQTITFGFQARHNAGLNLNDPNCVVTGTDGGGEPDPPGNPGEPGTDPDYPPITTGCNGYATRFWDCCKPHCGWTANVPSGMQATQSCSINNDPIADLSAPSACDGGNAHTCNSLVPIKKSNTLSYGYAATSSGDVCGRCFQLQFTGKSHNSPGDPGSAALLGKTMIVQAINIGYDVNGGQFDILTPGGGVGAFNACSNQWGAPNSELGAQYGGLLTQCKRDLGYNATLSAYKQCMTERCNLLFGSRGLTQLQQACHWYVNWFESADNPTLKFKEVRCPQE